MDEQELIGGLRAAVRDEPPIGLDPDQVITRAARRHRNRRMTLLAGAGVIAVIAVAVSFPVMREHTAPAVAPTKPISVPTPGSTLWPPAGVTVPQPSPDQLQARTPKIAEHLEAVLPKVATGTSRLHREDAVDAVMKGLLPAIQPTVSITEHVGPDGAGYYVSVQVAVPGVPVRRFTPRQVCARYKQDKPTTACSYLTEPNGDTIMISETDEPDRADAVHHSVTVTEYRADGTFVSAFASNPVGSGAPPPLTVDQLTALATDPEFTL